MKLIEPLDPRSLDIVERAYVAAHEAAHVVIALHLGRHAEGKIWKLNAPPENMRHWQGRTHIWDEDLTIESRRMAAAAGFVGEAVCNACRNMNPDLHWLVTDWIRWSPSDIERYGSKPWDDEILLLDVANRVWQLIEPIRGERWPDMREICVRLLREASFARSRN